MNLVLDLFTKKELMIIGVVIGSLVLIVLILTFLDILSRKKKENAELDMMFSEFDNIEPQLVKKKETLKVENTIDYNQVEETLVKETQDNSLIIEEIESLDDETTVESNIQNSLNELPKETEVPVENIVNKKDEYIEPLIIEDPVDNVKYVETKDKTEALEELLKIEEEINNPKSLEDTLYNLEALEEENAIISYQELLETTKELSIVNTDTGDEPISLKEILNMYEEPLKVEENKIDVENEMSKTTINDAYQGDFTSSPYLSPIVGLEYEKIKSNDLAEIQLENTANLEKLDKEMRKTNEFLSILNDLKKNLD